MQSFPNCRDHFPKLATAVLFSMIPCVAYGCLIDEHGKNCFDRYLAACSFGQPRCLFMHLTLTLISTTGKAICVILPLAGFYWAVSNKAIGWTKTSRLMIGQEIVLIAVITLLAYIPGFTFFVFLFLMLPGIWLLCWLWRKKIIWWKSLHIPSIIVHLHAAVVLVLMTHPEFNSSGEYTGY